MRLLTLGLSLVLFLWPDPSQAGALKNKGPLGVSGWLLVWEPEGMTSFEKNASLIDRVYVEWYTCGPDGMPHPNEEATPELKQRVWKAALAGHCQVWYELSNWNEETHEHDSNFVEKFLDNDDLRKKHIQALVDYGSKEKVAGIQIDYENLDKEDKDDFSRFMAELSQACHASGLLLGIAVHPKTEDAGEWNGPQAQDYDALGKVVDEIVSMTYDQHEDSGGAGPIASPDWVEANIRYAASVVPVEKLEMGIPAYGYDWAGKKGENITWAQLLGLCQKTQLKLQRDPGSHEIRGSYPGNHQVWFADAGAFQTKVSIAKEHQLAGVAVWRIGTEDPRFWDVIKAVNAPGGQHIS